MPRYLDHDATAILRRARRNWTCTGHTQSVIPAGPIHWQPQPSGNLHGAYPAVCRWTEHADGCPGTIERGSHYVEYVGDVPPYQSGPRYSFACAARYVFGETLERTQTRAWAADAIGSLEVREIKGKGSRGIFDAETNSCIVMTPPGSHRTDQAELLAQMAAAPMLVKALEATLYVVERTDADGDEHPDGRTVGEILRAALATAQPAGHTHGGNES